MDFFWLSCRWFFLLSVNDSQYDGFVDLKKNLFDEFKLVGGGSLIENCSTWVRSQ